MARSSRRISTRRVEAGNVRRLLAARAQHGQGRGRRALRYDSVAAHKLSTHGVKPMATLSTVATARQRMPLFLRVQRAQKLTMMSAQHAPTRPKTEAEAPTERMPGRKTIEEIVPKSPEKT